ncbi:hypothetical protein Tco_1388757 [Tanacetum coccineum]
MIDFCNVSFEDYIEDLFATNHLSGNPTPISDPIVSSSLALTSLEESDLIWEEFEAYLAGDSFPPGSDVTDFDPEEDLRLIEELLNNDPLSPLPFSHNPDHLLEEFADELALITFPPGNDDLPFDIEFDLREIEYLLNHDPTKEMDSIFEDSVEEGNLADPNNNLIDTIPEMFTDEHTLDFSSPPKYDDSNDDLFDLKTDNDECEKILYDDPFDSKKNKIKDFKLLIDELDSPGSSIFLPQSLECDSVFYEDFSEVDTLTSTDNENKVFNPGILIHENHFEVTNCAKNVKKTTNAYLILEDFNPPLYELPFHKEVPRSEILLLFSSKNEEKVFNLGILTSKGVHTSLLPKLSHWDSKALKVINIFENLMEIFPCSYGEDILYFGCSVSPFLSPLTSSSTGERVKLSDLKQALRGIAPDFEASRARGFFLRSLELHILSFIMRIQYPNIID